MLIPGDGLAVVQIKRLEESRLHLQWRVMAVLSRFTERFSDLTDVSARRGTPESDDRNRLTRALPSSKEGHVPYVRSPISICTRIGNE